MSGCGRNGICKVADGRYTKTIQFQDINYQLSQNEDKTAIFEGWCDFLNYFDSSIRFQLSFLNLAASQETFANSITIPAQGDDFDPIRVEYTQMLQKPAGAGQQRPYQDQVPDLFHRGRQHPLRQAPSGAHRDRLC